MYLQFNYFKGRGQSSTKVYTWRPQALAKNPYWPRVYWAALLLLVSVSIYFLYDLLVQGYSPIQLLLLPAVYVGMQLLYFLTSKIVIEQEAEMLRVSYYLSGRLRKRRTYLRDDVNGFYLEKGHLLISSKNEEYDSIIQSNDHSFKLELNDEELKKFVEVLNHNWKLYPNKIFVDESHISQQLQKYQSDHSYVLKKHNLMDSEQSFYIGTAVTWRNTVLGLVQFCFIAFILLMALFTSVVTELPVVIDYVIGYPIILGFLFLILLGIYEIVKNSSQTIILFQEHQKLRVRTILFYGLFSRNKYFSKKELDCIFIDNELGLVATIKNEQVKTSSLLINKKIDLDPTDLSYIAEQLNAFWELKEGN